MNFETMVTKHLEYELVNTRNIGNLLSVGLFQGMGLKDLAAAHNYLMERNDKIVEVLKTRPDANKELLKEPRGVQGIQGE